MGWLDEAAKVLPATVDVNDLGRATSVASKALKARELLYAASPLWNGGFPFTGWKNTNYETPQVKDAMFRYPALLISTLPNLCTQYLLLKLIQVLELYKQRDGVIIYLDKTFFNIASI